MRRGEIWAVDVEPNKGNEMRGRRPVLVILPAGFARITGIAITVPITGGGAASRMAGFAVPLKGFGLQTDGVVRCELIRAVDLKARGGRLVETVPEDIVNEVMAKIGAIME
jgi:mRNA interferase ChpB